MILSGLINRIKGIRMFEQLRQESKSFITKGDYLLNKDMFFFVYLPATDYYYLPYFQLYQYENVHVEFSYINSNEFFLRTLRKISSDLLYHRYTKQKYDPNKKYVFFFDGQYSLCSKGFKSYLQNKYPGCKIVFHLGDLLSTHKNINIKEIKEFSDLVVTFDHNDADNNGLTYHSDPYSVLPPGLLKSQRPECRLIFYGYAKNRVKEIMAVYDKMKAKGIRCDFSIPDLNADDCVKRPELANAQFTPYLEYLKRVQNADCILEIIQGGSRGCTFRTWEAVVYNKKLITNNQSVKEEQFYNPQFIQVIESFDSIDIDWLQREAKVDYGFIDKLSPKACFDFYMKCIENS